MSVTDDLAPASGHTDEVMRNRVHLMFDQMPVALVASVLIMGILMVAVWSSEEGTGRQPYVYGWVALVVLCAGWRMLLLRRFLRQEGSSLDGARWAQIYSIGAMCSGMAFGVGAFFLFGRHLDVGLASAYVLVVVSLILGSVMVHAPYTLAHALYVLPAALPVTVGVLLHREWQIQVSGGVLLLVVGGSFPMLRRARKAMFEIMELRAQKDELARQQAVLILKLEERTHQAQVARAQADEANAAKTRFFASASHDLRQPVQSVVFFAATLQGNPSGPDAPRLLGHVLSGVRELSQMLGGLLDYAKIDAAGVQPRMCTMAMDELLEKMTREFSAQAARKGLELRVVPCRAWVLSDPALLGRMVRNLLHNALRYTPSGKILLGCRRLPRGRLRIEVHDTGVGIPDDKQQAVFQEFVQLNNPDHDNRKGLGLGLAIVKGMADAMQHGLDVRSKVGKGTVFRITVRQSESLELSPVLDAPQNVPTLAQGTLLLIDDHQEVREATATMLRHWGYAVRGLNTGDEAMQLVDGTGFEPDAVLVDYRLRDGSTGLEALAQIRRGLGYPVPALMITGDTDPQIQQLVQAEGLQLLHKPVSPDELARALTQLLGQPPVHQHRA